jgi:hypothetical protein
MNSLLYAIKSKFSQALDEELGKIPTRLNLGNFPVHPISISEIKVT